MKYKENNTTPKPESVPSCGDGEKAEDLLREIYLTPDISFDLWSRVQVWYEKNKLTPTKH